MTTGLSIAVIVLAIVALWQARELLRRRVERAADQSSATLAALGHGGPTAPTARPMRAWDPRGRKQDAAGDLAVEVRALRRHVDELSGWINYRSQAFRAVHAGEEVPNLEQFVNMLMTGRIETFRLGIEQQLPMLAALRYATDEKLADVVIGLRAAAATRAPALRSAADAAALGDARQEALPAAPAKPDEEPGGDTAR